MDDGRDGCRSKARAAAYASLRCLPVLILLGLFVYSYYVYIALFCGTEDDAGWPDSVAQTLLYGDVGKQSVKAGLYIAFYNVLGVLFLTSYLRTIRESPGTTASLHSPQAAGVANIPLNHCVICDRWRAPRTHHCSTCDCCILKMDHHCAYVNACVGFGNYKMFYLMLLYGFVFSVFVFSTLLIQLLQDLAQDKLQSRDIQFLIVASAAAVLGLLDLAVLCYHTYLASRNMTTIEHLDRREQKYGPVLGGSEGDLDVLNPYDLGLGHNLRQVFGPDYLLWLLPMKTTPGDGIHFETRHDHDRRLAQEPAADVP